MILALNGGSEWNPSLDGGYKVLLFTSSSPITSDQHLHLWWCRPQSAIREIGMGWSLVKIEDLGDVVSFALDS